MPVMRPAKTGPLAPGGPNSPGVHGEVIRSTQHTVSHTREIADWVDAHYAGTFVGGSTVYRLF